MTDTSGWYQASDGNWYYGSHPRPYSAPPRPDGGGGWTDPVPYAPAAPVRDLLPDDGVRPDIAAARARMRTRWGGGREMKKLADHLWPGEAVRLMTTGFYGRGNGLLVLTDKRLLFVLEGVLSKTSEDFPLDKVTSVQWSSGLALGTVTIFAMGSRAEIKNVDKSDGKALVDAVRNTIGGLTAAPPAAPVPVVQLAPVAAPAQPAPNLVELLTQLAELRDRGILTEEEFAAQKARLLG